MDLAHLILREYLLLLVVLEDRNFLEGALNVKLGILLVFLFSQDDVVFYALLAIRAHY